jgi:hypothetical protein
LLSISKSGDEEMIESFSTRASAGGS